MLPNLTEPDWKTLRIGSVKAFWTRYERARAVDGVFLFWGHSYELINEAMWADLEEKIARISADPKTEWVRIERWF